MRPSAAAVLAWVRLPAWERVFGVGVWSEIGCKMLEVVVEITAEMSVSFSTSDDEIILYFVVLLYFQTGSSNGFGISNSIGSGIGNAMWVCPPDPCRRNSQRDGGHWCQYWHGFGDIRAWRGQRWGVGPQGLLPGILFRSGHGGMYPRRHETGCSSCLLYTSPSPRDS